MNRTRVAVKTGISAILIAAGVDAVHSASGSKPAAAHTATVEAVSSTVTATANLDAPSTVGVAFTTPGIVTAVPVKIGQEVQKGDVLAELDDRDAKENLHHAQGQLVSAEGEFLNAKAQVRNSVAEVAVARQVLCDARLAVSQAIAKEQLDTREQDAAVRAAEAVLDAAQRNISRSRSVARTNTDTTITGIMPPTPAKATNAQIATRTSNVTASTSLSSVAAASSALLAAQEKRASTLLADRQQVQTLIGAAQLAQANLNKAIADVPASPSGAAFGPTTQAEGVVQQARAQVKLAQIALSNTRLRAPFAGTVVDILGVAGESSSVASRGTTPPNQAGPGLVENRSPSTPSGFVVLADLTHKAVTAQVRETDIGKVRVGQPTNVTFPATGAVVTGVVSDVAVQETLINNGAAVVSGAGVTVPLVAYNVKIDLDGSAPAQKLGQSATVVITTADSAEKQFEVPNAAYTRVGKQAIVAVERGEHLVKVPVTVDLVGDHTSQISSPLLHQGDLVVIPQRSRPSDMEWGGGRVPS